jgi:hypothetical protein
MTTRQRFQSERDIIGRLLVGYGEMELDLCNCVAMGINDLDMVLKAMFRPRGETSRIKIAEAMGQKVYMSLGLGESFNEAVEAMHFCLKLRNRYAHSHFYDDNSGNLALVSLEEIAKKRAIVKNLLGLKIKHLTKDILIQQELYFVYTRACIEFVNYEGRYLRNTLSRRLFEMPTHVGRPQEFAKEEAAA